MTRAEVRLKVFEIVFRPGREPKHIIEDAEALEAWVLKVMDFEPAKAEPKAKTATK